MQVQLNIPEYLSVTDWKYFNSLEHMDQGEKMTTLISHFGGKDIEEVKQWTPAALQQVYVKLLDNISDLVPEFFPIIEMDEVLYGFTPISKMTLGEYVDLERLAKDSVANLEEIMAILYRPITKHRFNSVKWAFKNTKKIALGTAENLFKYYDTEKYDSNKRRELAEIMSNMPAKMGLGALSFFLVLGTSRSLSSEVSSLPPKEQMKAMKTMSQQMASLNIGGGLLLFITSLRLPSLTSQGRKLSLTSTLSSPSTSLLMSRINQKGMSRLENYKNEHIV